MFSQLTHESCFLTEPRVASSPHNRVACCLLFIAGESGCHKSLVLFFAADAEIASFQKCVQQIACQPVFGLMLSWLHIVCVCCDTFYMHVQCSLGDASILLK